MKKLLLVTTACLTLAGCGSVKSIEGVRYDTCGLFSLNDCNPNIKYRLVVANVVLGVIFFETIIVPIYVFGFDLYEPECKRPAIQGQAC